MVPSLPASSDDDDDDSDALSSPITSLAFTSDRATGTLSLPCDVFGFLDPADRDEDDDADGNKDHLHKVKQMMMHLVKC